MDNKIQPIIDTVQHNCHIADARHAGDYTLCVYLLKMREMYRWEQGIDFTTMLTTDDVGDWRVPAYARSQSICPRTTEPAPAMSANARV